MSDEFEESWASLGAIQEEVPLSEPTDLVSSYLKDLQQSIMAQSIMDNFATNTGLSRELVEYLRQATVGSPPIPIPPPVLQDEPRYSWITLQQAQTRIQEIRDQAIQDFESAHMLEDQFRHEILQAISNGSPHSRELAHLALSTSEITFSRWYA
jgi:hypothetical protein